ncbi:MAG: hypothetical protein AAF709_19675 [Pseudomonadota bacterium]
MDEIACHMQRVELAINRLTSAPNSTLVNSDIQALQHIDFALQSVKALGAFIRHLGPDHGQDARIDIVPALSTVPLRAMSARLGGTENHPNPKTENVDLF